MKKRVSLLLLLLSCATQLTFAQYDKQIDSALQSALASKDLSSEKRAKLAKCFELPGSICCKRGKRGKRGPRGPRGSSGSGLNELFLNAQMMAWFSEGTFPPNDAFAPYSVATNMLAWRMLPSTTTSQTAPIGANFNIPIDLDRTEPVIAVIHLLVDSFDDPAGGQAKLRVNIDYQPNNGLLGATPPATDFADTQDSADFTVSIAIPALSSNLRQISVPVPLDQTQIDGEWAFITVERIAPAANEFSGLLFLSTISIQYTRISS